MIQFFRNVRSVAKYESKLLVRSWFFKVFTFIAVVGLGGFTYGILFEDSNWPMTCIPSLFPYIVMLMLNVGQAVVSIFLSSEYLKRDKQLDTSEVFYVRPLSNAQYLIGKMWGTLRVFFLLDIFLLGGAMVASLLAIGSATDYISYLIYFLLLSVPTLIFIIGLSTTVMLLIRNQALTFVIVLGYVGLTLFYIGDFYYYLFDYLGFNIPMMQSTITGFSDLPGLLNHRFIYLFLGLGFICLSIFKFGRLPNSKRKRYIWVVYACFFFAIGLWAGFGHVHGYIQKDNLQQSMIALNNEHVNDPKMVIDSCRLDIRQQGDELAIEAQIQGVPVRSASAFTFSLNPGMKVASVKRDGNELSFKRDKHLLFIDFGKEIAEGEPVRFVINYEGKVDERMCYLDIPEEMLVANEQIQMMPLANPGKRYAYQTDNYVLLTPETYWYPRPGVSYSDKSPDWQQNYFTNYSLKVTPKAGLVPISQGVTTETDGVYEFKPEQPLQSVSLLIGDYEEASINVDSTEYAVKYIKGHNFFSEVFESIQDTIPSILREVRRGYENNMKLTYPFKRFSIVEVPAQFATYSRTWTMAQETMQPEMVLLPEKGYKFWAMNYPGQIKWRKRAIERGWERNPVSDEQMRIDLLNRSLWFMNEKNSDFKFEEGKLGRNSFSFKENPFYLFPQMYNFRYNLYSSTWPVANRLIELFFQGDVAQDEWMRRAVGLSNDEKALLMMQERSFKDLLTETKYRELINNFIRIETSQLFAEGQMNMGIEPFQDSLFSIVKANEFKNLSFETLLDSMGKLSNSDLFKPIESWTEPSKLPEYLLGTPSVTRIVNLEKDVYQAEMVISNISDVPGYIQFGLYFNNSYNTILGPGLKPRQWIVHFDPGETKRIVSHWEEEQPMQFQISTQYAKNLPLYVNLQAGNVNEGRTLTDEGEYEVSSDFLKNKGETIIDNEDSLFRLSAAPPSGFLNYWIDQSMDEDFKYTAIRSWRPPSRWTATTDEAYYGLSVRSAYGIRSGDGSQTATWTIPIERRGKHELFYHLRKPEEMRWGGHRGRGRRDPKEYNLTIQYGNETEKVALDLNQVEDGWVLIDTYDFDCDTVTVTLNNKSQLNLVIADAVKIVNIDEAGRTRQPAIRNQPAGGRMQIMRIGGGGGAVRGGGTGAVMVSTAVSARPAAGGTTQAGSRPRTTAARDTTGRAGRPGFNRDSLFRARPGLRDSMMRARQRMTGDSSRRMPPAGFNRDSMRRMPAGFNRDSMMRNRPQSPGRDSANTNRQTRQIRHTTPSENTARKE